MCACARARARVCVCVCVYVCVCVCARVRVYLSAEDHLARRVVYSVLLVLFPAFSILICNTSMQVITS